MLHEKDYPHKYWRVFCYGNTDHPFCEGGKRNLLCEDDKMENDIDLKELKLALYEEIAKKYKRFGYNNLSEMFDQAVATCILKHAVVPGKEL